MERAGRLGGFGDKRRAAVGDFLLERIVETGSLVVRKLGASRAKEIAIHRFLSSPAVRCEEIVETLLHRTQAACSGRRIVAVQDTTEVNFSGRDAARRGLGPGGDGKSAGFFIHPVIAIDSASEAVLGLVHAHLWTRALGKVSSRRRRPLEAKESLRWLEGLERASGLLRQSASVCVVGDRESDVYSVFARRPRGVDVVIRAGQDRSLESGRRLFSAADAWPELARLPVKVAAGKGLKSGREASVALRAGRVTINRPAGGCDARDPESLSMTCVEAREVNPPAGQKPLLWRLLTNLEVTDAEAAREIIRLYRLRWRIEETFRALKSDGLRLEDVQIHEAERLMKLATIALAAAVRTLQLVDARDGSSRPATDVIDPDLLPAAEAILPTLEGKTQRQKNPHPPHSLAWLAWIIARLGGWNCYYKPPGPKTMQDGWKSFASMAYGYTMANTLQNL